MRRPASELNAHENREYFSVVYIVQQLLFIDKIIHITNVSTIITLILYVAKCNHYIYNTFCIGHNTYNPEMSLCYLNIPGNVETVTCFYKLSCLQYTASWVQLSLYLPLYYTKWQLQKLDLDQHDQFLVHTPQL